jgi:hypothetical protein
MFLRRRVLSASCRLLSFALCATIASSTLEASQAVEGVLDRGGDQNWVGAFLLDGPKEAAKALLTLPRGEKVRVWPARGENGYLYVERLGPGGKVTRTGFVHRKFLKLQEDASATAKPTASNSVPPATAASKPAVAGANGSAASTALQAKLETLEARLEEMNRRLSALERDGIPDPGVDFLQRLQKLEMEVHSRDTSSLPTVPFPEVPRQDSGQAPASAASRIPGVSWLLGSW